LSMDTGAHLGNTETVSNKPIDPNYGSWTFNYQKLPTQTTNHIRYYYMHTFSTLLFRLLLNHENMRWKEYCLCKPFQSKVTSTNLKIQNLKCWV
jgi:hypothetical protein